MSAPHPLDPAALLHASGGADIIGTAKPDHITGTDGNDAIHGMGSEGDPDVLLGGHGHDALYGADGTDVLVGEAGNDALIGRGGADHMLGGEGNDLLIGGTGADYVNGGEGNDLIVWQAGDGGDQVVGGAGHDVLVLSQTGLTLAQILTAIEPHPGGAAPRLMDDGIDLTGVSGRIVIGDTVLTFAGLEKLVV